MNISTHKTRSVLFTAFLVVVTITQVLSLTLFLNPEGLAFSVGTSLWKVFCWEALEVAELLAIAAIWLWSKSGVAGYIALIAVFNLPHLIHGANINWVSVATVPILLVFIRPYWSQMSWYYGRKAGGEGSGKEKQ